MGYIGVNVVSCELNSREIDVTLHAHLRSKEHLNEKIEKKRTEWAFIIYTVIT